MVLFGVSFFSGPVGGRAEGPSESDLGVSSLSRIIIEQKGSAFFEAVSEVQGGPNPPNMVYGVGGVIKFRVAIFHQPADQDLPIGGRPSRTLQATFF